MYNGLVVCIIWVYLLLSLLSSSFFLVELQQNCHQNPHRSSFHLKPPQISLRLQPNYLDAPFRSEHLSGLSISTISPSNASNGCLLKRRLTLEKKFDNIYKLIQEKLPPQHHVLHPPLLLHFQLYPLFLNQLSIILQHKHILMIFKVLNCKYWITMAARIHRYYSTGTIVLRLSSSGTNTLKARRLLHCCKISWISP